MEKINKIVLAYSGGLDTSVAIKWLKEKYGAEIIAYCANVGQDDVESWDLIERKGYQTGASKVYIDDLKEEFVNEYIFKAVKAGVKYEGKYPLATALSRPLISKKMVDIARKHGADAVAHGCTGKGNDQVRFEVSFRALDPDLKIIAPVRFWEFKTRNEEIEYAKANNIPVTASKESPYSLDSNLWGIAVECGVLEDPWCEPPADAYFWTTAPEEAPAEPEYVTITFEKGIPVMIDGVAYKPVEIIEKLNKIGAKHGVGRIDMVENRLVGIKSREIYEAPAAVIIQEAHQHLEDLTLDRETLHFKYGISQKYSELVYYGLWYSPLREALDAFVDETQQVVSGEVRVKLYRGTATVVGRRSPYSQYQYKLATYDEDDSFDHKSAEGFIKLWGLPVQVSNIIKRNNGISTKKQEN
ncbi:MAG TPA: argininosuccinate synthase [Halanaerobiaceae bacterium]|jgi:argininosuccinate synthase|nr:argininosuccinate synthase [Bacillota bacterium]HHU93231.1 argininosuccinate synthase [Halanaerobiaceae bacterium]HOA40919.1 argininosuccinate synthase [Halanaerobiales bacterium]HPZ62495.1 argininosuccinate synthase [Halanaerobiales bacterium]HQD03714.1 argininosuccinate synthase [Halanaerobiales bacterium]